MYSRNLSCPGCRIRVRASAPNIHLLEGNCPICGATLIPASSASSVMGFRSFDLAAFSEQDPSDPSPTFGEQVDLVAGREAGAAQDGVDGERWSDDGGSVNSRAVAKWLTMH
jgi:hypothetical protein